MIAEFDAMVGKYVDTVKAAGVWEQTVTIVTSDHGDMQMEHQQFYKMVPYDASASVPMIIHDARPGRQNPKAGPEIEHPTQLIDIFPTILTLVQVPQEKWPVLDGKSLTPFMAVDSDAESTALALDATPSGRPDFVVSQFHGDNIAMSWYLVVKEGVAMPAPAEAGSTTTYKLIVWGTGKEVPSLLFDLVNDPMENTNLIKDEAGLTKYAGIVSTLEQNLRSVVDYPTLSLEVATCKCRRYPCRLVPKPEKLPLRRRQGDDEDLDGEPGGLEDRDPQEGSALDAELGLRLRRGVCGAGGVHERAARGGGLPERHCDAEVECHDEVPLLKMRLHARSFCLHQPSKTKMYECKSYLVLRR